MKKTLFSWVSLMVLLSPLITVSAESIQSSNEQEVKVGEVVQTDSQDMLSDKVSEDQMETVNTESQLVESNQNSQSATAVTETQTSSKLNDTQSGTSGEVSEKISSESVVTSSEEEQEKNFDFFSRSNLKTLSPYLNDQEKYQELLEGIKDSTDYAANPTAGADNLRAGKNKGVASFLGISPEKALKQLTKHQSDRYYLGTPFKGLWLPNAQNMSPLGNPNKYGPGFNCTGFVATVFKEAGARNSEITNRYNAWGGIANAYNWRNALVPNVEYYTYNSVNALLSSGKATKGDILYFEPDFSIPGYDPHIGFFWGNNSSHNRMWHSYDANIMSNIKAGRPWTKIYLFKLKQTKPSNEQGKYQSFGKTVQIKSNNYNIFKNFDWDVKFKSKEIYQKTYLAKGKYQHKNGTTYYSLYDHNNQWVGYINSAGTKITDSQGTGIVMNDYVTLSKKNYTVWTDFKWKKRYQSDEKLGQQFKAKVKYNHANGQVYYSLYDQNDKWQGYVNKNALTIDPSQGKYQSLGKYVQIKSNNYNIFKNFKWDVKFKSQSIYQKTYLAKGKYQHKNGTTYYSIYDKNNEWVGYINSSGVKITDIQGSAITMNDYVTLSKKNYTVWTDFKWKKRYQSNEKLGQQFKAKVKYNHANGQVYYSLYDQNDKWQGYVNKGALSIDPAQGNYQTFGKKVQIKSKNYNIFKNFKWDKIGMTDTIYGKTYLAKGKYLHKNGTTYYSLYDDNNKWLGYINSDGAKVL